MQQAEIVFRNGRIWTGCEDLAGVPQEASALAVRGGKIAAVGTDEEVRAFAGAADVVDLGGRRVVPGLIDSHMHAVRAGVSWNRSLHWEDLRSLTQGLQQIEERAAATPPGTWISVVGGWHSRQLAEGRGPTRAELDEVAPDHPVYVQELYDRGTLNSAALRACGWDDTSAEPDRGTLGRDVEGRLTGEIFGVGAFGRPIAQALATTPEDARAGTRQMFRDFAAHGLTGVDDGGGLLITPGDYRPLYDLWRGANLDMRVRLFMSAWTRGDEVGDIAALTQVARPDFGDELLRVAGVGEIPHLGCHDMEGLDPFALTDEAYEGLVEVVRTCVHAGWRMSVHAVLDSTLTRIIDAWEQVEAETGLVRGRRFSIVHADQASEANLDRLSRLEAGVMVQNRMMLKATDYRQEWGEESLAGTPPIGRMRERGIPVGGGSDATRANWYAPWASIWWLVTGESVDGVPPRGAEHRLTVAEALASYTRDAAWFTEEEGHRGRLAPGYDADLCVPTADPFECEAPDLRNIRSDLTVLGGRVTHASGAFADLAPASTDALARASAR
ncbi:amidohydrolase [Georgenia sp. SYP-B2076]|uniref:amidohydrolase n=1 Tax=Georgenia sp. SYP-B2076 TaxID=2495881 RepID=UPI0013E014C2|nr:amidohydrolase [Georgenia sp. SYP-B2076]